MRRVFVAAVAGFLAFAGTASAATLTPADRASINRTLDGFVNSAVKRKNVGASYDLVTPQLRGGMTRAAWAKGDIPVYPYAALGTKFRGWTVSYREGNELGIVLMLRPQNPKQETFAFDVTMRKRAGRWLVDLFLPAATFANTGPGRVVGPHDFLAASGENGTGETKLSAVWIAVPSAVAVLGLLIALAALAASWRRNRAEPVPVDERRRYDEFAARVERSAAARYSQRL